MNSKLELVASDSFRALYEARSSDRDMRSDLQESIGFIVSQPPHHLSEDGSVVWGDFLEGGPYGSQVVFNQIEDLVIEAINSGVEESPQLPSIDEDFTHLYDHPPAAQGLPEIAAIMWEHGRPLLDEAMVGYQIGRYLRNVARKFHENFEKADGTVGRLNDGVRNATNDLPLVGLEPKITWTQGALISLVIAELVDRIGYQEDLEIDSHARGLGDFDSSGHPNSRLTYLMRIAYGGLEFGYVIDSTGEVTEYFRVEENEFVSLPIPELLNHSYDKLESRPLEEKLRLRMSGS